MAPSQKISAVNVSKGKDKRFLPRWEVNNRISCQFGNSHQVYQCVSKDLSCSGACFYSDVLPASNQVKLKIFLSERQSVDVKGKLAWKKMENDRHLLGVSFFETPEAVQETILKYAFEINRKDIVRHWFNGWGS